MNRSTIAIAAHGVDVVQADGRVALAGLNLTVRRGERIALIGPSGAGKTSLLRLCGLGIAPARGRLTILDQSPWSADARGLRAVRRRIGHVHQLPAIPPRQRVVHAVLAGALGRWPWWRALSSLVMPADCEGAERELAKLALADRLFDRCDRLSGGQLQRVALARVLYQRPDLVLADEPVSAMDPALADTTVGLLVADARERGATLVASLHAVELALRHFERVVGIGNGQILFDLPPQQIDTARLERLYAVGGGPGARPDPAPAVAAGLAGATLVPCR
ncbi:MAG: ATP-binding cassette domain-containing protein [Rhodocyclaceae bacterium]|nr:ATP-binding cassette domain-containing protein [Rhodocyclaceae bacterium]